MKLSELMAGRTVKPDFKGKTVADHKVLALNLADPKGTHPDDYFVAQKGVTEHSGSLEAQTADSTYIREGQVTTKVGTTRTFSVNGDEIIGDEFQDALLSFAIKYGTGQDIIADYVHFNILTGKGEKGLISIVVEDDAGGAAGENSSWSATLTSEGTPSEYAYEAKAPGA